MSATPVLKRNQLSTRDTQIQMCNQDPLKFYRLLLASQKHQDVKFEKGQSADDILYMGMMLRRFDAHATVTCSLNNCVSFATLMYDGRTIFTINIIFLVPDFWNLPVEKRHWISRTFQPNNATRFWNLSFEQRQCICITFQLENALTLRKKFFLGVSYE